MWERLVSLLKSCLKKTVGVKVLNFVELQTLVADVEVTLNNRPLCQPVEDDIDILTPNHLVFGGRLELSSIDGSENIYYTEGDCKALVKRQRHLMIVRKHFFSRVSIDTGDYRR